MPISTIFKKRKLRPQYHYPYNISAIIPIVTSAVEIDALVMYDAHLEDKENGKPIALIRSLIEQSNVIY